MKITKRHLRKIIREVLEVRILSESSRVSSLRRDSLDFLKADGILSDEDANNILDLLQSADTDQVKQGVAFLSSLSDIAPEWGEIDEDLVLDLRTNQEDYDRDLVMLWNQRNGSNVEVYHDITKYSGSSACFIAFSKSPSDLERFSRAGWSMVGPASRGFVKGITQVIQLSDTLNVFLGRRTLESELPHIDESYFYLEFCP